MSKVRFTEEELVGFIEGIVENEISTPKQPTLSESKNRRLINWADRFERKNIGKSPDIMCENFVKDMHKLTRAGFTLDEISYSLKHNKKYLVEQEFTMSKNQGMMGTLWDGVLEGIWRMILNMFGIKGEMKEVMATTLGNVQFFDIPKLLNCDFLTTVLTKSIVFEYLPRRVARQFTSMEGGDTMEVLLGNTFANLADNTEFYKDVERQIREIVCGKLKEKKKQVKDAIKDGERKNDEKTKYGTTTDVELDVETEEEPEDGASSVKGALGGIGDIFTKYMNKYKANLGE